MKTVKIHAKHVKQCSKCGADIAFVTNRAGKWYPVDVTWAENTRPFAARRYGVRYIEPLYSKGWHVCQPTTEERLVNLHKRLIELEAYLETEEAINDWFDHSSEIRELQREIQRQEEFLAHEKAKAPTVPTQRP